MLAKELFSNGSQNSFPHALIISTQVSKGGIYFKSLQPFHDQPLKETGPPEEYFPKYANKVHYLKMFSEENKMQWSASIYISFKVRKVN